MTAEATFPATGSEEATSGRTVTVVYKVKGLTGDAPTAVLGALAQAPAINAAVGDLKVASKQARVSEDGKHGEVTVTLSKNGSQSSSKAPSELDKWTREGSSTLSQTQTQIDADGNAIKVKYQPPGAAAVGDDAKYNRVIQFPITEGKMTLGFRRLTDSDPYFRAKLCTGAIDPTKQWKCVGSEFPQTANADEAASPPTGPRWEERYHFTFSDKGWPEECGFWENPDDNTIPPDVVLPNADKPSSIGTSANGVVRPKLGRIVDFEAVLGIAFPKESSSSSGST